MPLKYETLKRARDTVEQASKYAFPMQSALFPRSGANVAKGAENLLWSDPFGPLHQLGVSKPPPPHPGYVRQAATNERSGQAGERRRDARREDKHLAQPGVVPGYTEPKFLEDPQRWRYDWKVRGSKSTPRAWPNPIFDTPAWTSPNGPSAYPGLTTKTGLRYPGANWAGPPYRDTGYPTPDWGRQGLARQAGFPDPVTGRTHVPQAVARALPNFQSADDPGPYRGKGTDLSNSPHWYMASRALAPYPAGGGVPVNFGDISDKDWMRGNATWQQKKTYEQSEQNERNRKSMMDYHRGQRGGNLTLQQKLSFPTR